MKIRQKLTLIYSLLQMAILLTFALFIYFSAQKTRQKEFYELLEKEAITKANLFFEAGIDPKILQDIYRNNRRTINEVEVAIYDTSFTMLYHDAADIDIVKETKPMIDSVAEHKFISFYVKKYQAIGFLFNFNNKPYVVTAAAFDQYGYNKLNKLLINILIYSAIALIIIVFTSFYLARKTFKPIKKLNERVKEISASNLYLRLETNNNKDELNELATTFNGMLERLNNAFDSQNQFVSNIAHELRTPLSAIITELELTSIKERSEGEYKKVIKNTYSDVKKLVRLINNLLDFAKANYDANKIAFKPVRIDEVLLDAKLTIQKLHPDYTIDIRFKNEIEDLNKVTLNGNEYFLRVAFINLYDNGCKYSNDKRCVAEIDFEKENIIINFKDNGIGIAYEDVDKIFQPFYRGENSNTTKGSGIGLSLVSKVVTLHKGEISVHSIMNKGTTFSLNFPSLTYL